MVESVNVDLYQDVNGNGMYDAGTDVYVSSTTTDASGNYLFTGLTFGDYMVVLPETNFAAGAALENFRSSDDTILADDPENNTSGTDSGVMITDAG